MATDLDRKNKKVLLIIGCVLAVMIGLTALSVPLYSLFCRVTGFGGTTQVAQSFPDEIIERTVTVSFFADTAPDLPWTFKPEQKEITVKLGQKGITSYLSQNNAAVNVTGTAVYNVSPPKAGKYFHKVQCFCFGEQTLTAGEQVHMPVLFYVDPAMADDPSMDDVNAIALSYTFYKTSSSALEQAVEDFYNEPAADGAPVPANNSFNGVN